MKKILTLLAIALVGLTSCTPEEEEIVPPEPEQEAYLNVYYDNIVFPSNGGEDYFDIESNTDWIISNTSDWLTIEPTEGNGNSSITLTASASDVYDDRNTVITVKAGDKTETFTQKPCLSQKTNSIFHKRVETLLLKFKVIYHMRFKLIQTVSLGFRKSPSQKH